MVKYILDEKGKKKEVIIPLEVWEKVKDVYQKAPIKRMDKSRLKEFSRKIHLSLDPVDYQKG
jgi:hypothetical protein